MREQCLKSEVHSCQEEWGWSVWVQWHLTLRLGRRVAHWQPPPDSTPHWRTLEKQEINASEKPNNVCPGQIQNKHSFTFSWIKFSYINTPAIQYDNLWWNWNCSLQDNVELYLESLVKCAYISYYSNYVCTVCGTAAKPFRHLRFRFLYIMQYN